MTDPTVDETLNQRSKQAAALRRYAAHHGLRFECYLPSRLASWLLEKVEQKAYNDPEHAIYAIVNDHVQLERLSCVRDTLIQRSLERSSGGYWPVQTLEEVGQYLAESDRYQTQGVPAYWNLNGSTEQVLTHDDDDMIREIMHRFSSYSEATAWYRSRPLPGFGGATAAALVREGRAQEVIEYLEGVDAGIFS
jgi:hypothetical protein